MSGLIRSGAHFVFDLTNQTILSEQWESEKIEPDLRFALIVATMLYHEQGASRMRIVKLLGNTREELENTNTPHHYGCAADISVAELIKGTSVNGENSLMIATPRINWIVDRINELLPWSEGKKLCASNNRNHIHIEVPLGGFKKSHFALATWAESGPTGIPKRMPRHYHASQRSV